MSCGSHHLVPEEQASQLRQVVDLLTEAAYALGVDGRVLAWNPALEELTGVSASVLLGARRREVARVLWGADRPCLAELALCPETHASPPFRTLRREGDSLLLDSEPAELRGKQHLLSAKATPLRDSSGTPWAALEILRSLPRIVPEAQARQEGSTRRLGALFEHIPEGLLLIDPFDAECPNRILDCNPAACALHGLPKDQILGRSVSALGPEPDLFAGEPSQWRHLARDADLTFRVEHLHANGSKLHLEVSRSSIELEGKRLALCVVRDVTQRIASEQDQQEATERFTTLFRYSPDAILLLDPWDQEVPMRIVDCNAVACELNGYSRDELVGQSINLLNYPPSPPESLLEHARWHYELLKQEGSVRGDAQHLRKDGTLVDVEFASCLVTVGGKELVLSIDRDVGERRRQEEQYREAAERFQILFQNSPDGGLLMDPDDPEVPRRIVDCNPALCEMHGYTREELIGQSIDIFGPADLATRQELRRRWDDRNLQPYSSIHRFEIDHLHKDGRSLRVDVSACRVTLEGRDLMLSLERDITERHAAEQSYRELMGRFEVLFESSPDSIMLMDPHDPEVPLRILDCNPAACRINGYTREELLGQPVSLIEASPQFGAEERQRAEFVLSVAQSGDPLRGQTLHRRKDGALRDIEYSVSLVTLGGKDLLLGVDRDVTDLRRVEQAHQEATERFEALFANCPDGVILMDPFDPEVPLRIVDCNPAACEMNGYSREELLGQSLHLLHPDRRPAEVDLPAAREWAETLRRERVGRGQGVHLRKDGTPIQIDFSVCLVSLGGRELILGIDRDVTQRQRIEEALREAAERFQTLFTHSPDAILLLDVEDPDRPAVIMDCNPAACELNGYSREEMIGQSISLLDVVPTTPTHPVDFQLEPVPGAPDAKPHLRFEVQHRHRDGQLLTLDVSACRLSLNGRKLMLTIERDVTRRRQQEHALQEAAKRFETLFTNSPDAVLLLDPHDSEVPLRILDCNPMACRINGYSREEMVGQPLDLLHERMNPPEIAWEWAQYGVEQMRLHGLHRGGGRHKRKDGTLCDIEYSSCLITLEGRELVLTFDRDVTERQQAEQAYRDAMTRFESLFRHCPDALFLIDPRDEDCPGRILDCNPVACQMNGHAHEELVGRSIYDLDARRLGHRGRKQAAEKLLRITHEEGTARFNRTHVTKDGRPIDLEISACIVPLAGRELVVTIERDVTERNRSEQAYRDAMARFESLFSHSPDMILVYDPHDSERPGRIVDCNPAACSMNGYTRDEFLDLTIADLDPSWLAHEDLQGDMLNLLRRLREEGIVRGASTHRRRDGSEYEIEYAICPVTVGGRELILGIDRDVTERHLAEQQRLEATARFETLFRHSPDMVVLYDPRDPEIPGRIVDCNPATCLYNGYTREELVGQPISLLEPGWAPETAAKERMPEFLDRILVEGPVRGASTHRRKDGSSYEIEFAACPVSLGGRDLILGIDRDLTERKRLEEELRQSQKMEAVGRLAGGVAHDFNNLLTAILGYADLLESSLPEGSAPARSAGEIRKAGERAADLTHQLLAFSRRQLLEPRVLDLNGVVADMDRMLQRLIGEDIELETILRPDLDSVLVDPGQISQVLLNLAINARDAMPTGGKLTIETANVVLGEEYALRHPDSASGPHVMVAVSDSGTGIPEEVLPHIFEPFYTTKERGKGTGLGLSTVYGIVRQSGGTVWVYSEMGRGTTFEVYLPSANRSDSSDRSVPALEARGGSETVLVVEDEEVVRALVRHVLEAQGYRVLIASTPSEALELAAEGDPHLVLTDVVMPEMNGRELAELLLAAHSELKVLYMSGYTENAIVHHGALEEGVAFLQKPFRPETLAAKVRAVLDGA